MFFSGKEHSPMASPTDSTAPPEASCEDTSAGGSFEQTLARLEEIVTS